MPDPHIITCPYNPAMRASYWPKHHDHERNTQRGGFLQVQYHHPTYGWCDIDETHGGFAFATHPLIALAKAHRLFKDEVIEAFVEHHGCVPEEAL